MIKILTTILIAFSFCISCTTSKNEGVAEDALGIVQTFFKENQLSSKYESIKINDYNLESIGYGTRDFIVFTVNWADKGSSFEKIVYHEQVWKVDQSSTKLTRLKTELLLAERKQK